MLKTVCAGLALLVSGALQLAHHLDRPPTLADYLAFRCGPADPAFGPGTIGHTVLAVGHCWGCYAMAIGTALLALAASRALRRPHQSARLAR